MSSLSIVIPFYNCANEIFDLIASVSANDRLTHQFIFINDASTDTSLDIVIDGTELFRKSTIISNSSNSGVSYCRNLGLLNATEQYVVFIDADDWILSSYLSSALNTIMDIIVDFVKFDHVIVEGQKRYIRHCPEARRLQRLDPRDPAHFRIHSTMIDYPQPWTGIYRTDFLRQYNLLFDTELHTAEDRLWTWELHLNASSCAVSSNCGYFYRKHTDNSLTKVGDERQLHFSKAVAKTVHALHSRWSESTFYRNALIKCARTSAALVAFHHERIDRLSEDTLGLFHDRASELLRLFSEDTMNAALVDFGETRLGLIERYR